MSRLEIARQANLLDEAYILLYQWINQGDIEKSREEHSDHYLSDQDNYNRRFQILSEMFNYVINNIKSEKERINYYFKERNPEHSTFAALALHWDSSNTTSEIPSYQERIGKLSTEQRVRAFAENINGEEAANTPEEELSTYAALITFLEASSFDQASKWEAVKIFNNQEACYNEVRKILNEVMELLRGRYSGQISSLSQEFYEYWSEYQKSKDIIQTINETLKVSWGISEKGAILAPVLFMPFSKSISIDSDPNKCKDVIRIGIQLDERFDISDCKLKKGDVVEIGKLLCDKSKVDILEYVSIKPCYGKELATEMNLSTATISYHVNALLKMGFLQAQVIANKVYYSIDRVRISELLDNVKGFLTKL